MLDKMLQNLKRNSVRREKITISKKEIDWWLEQTLITIVSSLLASVEYKELTVGQIMGKKSSAL